MPRIVVPGHLDGPDGVIDILHAVAMMEAVEVVVVGTAPEAMAAGDAVGRELLRTGRELGLGDRFQLRQHAPRAERPGLLRSADVVASCPRFDPTASPIIEAMACAVPVVTTGVGMLGDVVVHGRTGLRVPPGQPERIAEALGRLLADADLRAAMGRAGRRRAGGHGWHAVAAQTFGHLAALAARQGGQRRPVPAARLPRARAVVLPVAPVLVAHDAPPIAPSAPSASSGRASASSGRASRPDIPTRPPDIPVAEAV
jgi:glycosyltransferase involved in cell wall biosynthesis